MCSSDLGRFVPVSRLNQVRRDLVADLEEAQRRQRAERVARIQAEAGGGCGARLERAGEASRQARSKRAPQAASEDLSPEGFRWSLKVDRIHFLDALEDSDLAGVEEIVIDVTRDHPALLHDKLRQWEERVGRERLRLALPALTRFWEEKGLRQKIRQLREAGWRRWEAANLSAWNFLDLDPLHPEGGGLDLATDWSVYVLNRLAAQALVGMGVGRFALSPEDGLENLRSLLAEYGSRAVVIVYQDTPQFLAESCAYANLIGGCPGKANCKFESMEMVSSHGERVTALDYHCRTIVLNQGPFCLSPRLADLAAAGARNLRADFVYRPYEAHEVRDRWRLVRGGKPIPGGHAANFDRGIL